MSALLINPLAFLLFTIASCDKKELVRENVAVNIEFRVKKSNGDLWIGKKV